MSDNDECPACHRQALPQTFLIGRWTEGQADRRNDPPYRQCESCGHRVPLTAEQHAAFQSRIADVFSRLTFDLIKRALPPKEYDAFLRAGPSSPEAQEIIKTAIDLVTKPAPKKPKRRITRSK